MVRDAAQLPVIELKAQQQAWSDGLRGLALLDEGLWQRACDWVRDGSGEAVLAELRARAPRAGHLLGQPGRMYRRLELLPDEPATLVRKAMVRRSVFYAGLDAGVELALLVRLGRLLEAADQYASLQRGGGSAPDWLQYLVNDALWASVDGARIEAGSHAAWNVRLLDALLRSEGLPRRLGLQHVFERRDVPPWASDYSLHRLLGPGPLDDHMLDDPDAVEGLLRRMSPGGQAALAQRICASAPLAGAFAPLMVCMAVDGDKAGRGAAAAWLGAMDDSLRAELLQKHLHGGAAGVRQQAAVLLGRMPGTRQIAMLEQALAAEKGKTVRQAIGEALSRLNAAMAEPAPAAPASAPAAPDSTPDTPLGEEVLAILRENQRQMLEKYRQLAQKEMEEGGAARAPSAWTARRVAECAALGEQQLRALLQALNGETEQGQGAVQPLSLPQVSNLLGWKGRLAAHSRLRFTQLARWLSFKSRVAQYFWGEDDFTIWLAHQPPGSVDLRMLDDAFRAAGDLRDGVAMACLADGYPDLPRPQAQFAADCIWPFFEQRAELIDQGLGLAANPRAAEDHFRLDATLEVLQTFPQLPARWLPRVMELALGEHKAQRASAQAILAKLPGIARHVAGSLASERQEIRMRAARWLGMLGQRDAVPALHQALRKERREVVRAALMSALERLGENLAPLLAPGILLAEAVKGLQGKSPAGLSWFAFEKLPPCAWLDGAPVPPDVVRWWLVLACKLKEPRANPLLLRYLGLLHPDSRAALGLAVLRQFIAHDTRPINMDAAVAHAHDGAARVHRQYQEMARDYPEAYAYLGELTVQQVFEQLKQEQLMDYAGSAIGEKGVLALACHAPGPQAVAELQAYMRDHYLRRAQIEAVLESLAAGADPAVVQLLLAVARRHRTASVQEKAGLLVERIAVDKGWSAEQLADRTIATGGLDDQGRLDLDYAGRAYYVTLDEAMKPVLHNAEGRPVTSLPEPRQHDAPASIRDAKQRLSACRKQVAQVISLQTARLYGAMCAGRQWPVEEWRTCLHAHPVAGRLLQKLVWMELAPDGALRRLFRPVEDGSLVDAGDNDVALAGDSLLQLAHATLLEPAQVSAWMRHLRDYKLAPLFAQLHHAAPPSALRAGPHIEDRLGWLSDNFALRGAFAKRGYVREAAIDGGVFEAYRKDFSGAGLRVRISFSGSQLPEERQPAALKALAFQRLPGLLAVPLAQVPGVLLAEAYADYHAVATSGAYDEHWESKVPF